jgi:hypothetical protein
MIYRRKNLWNSEAITNSSVSSWIDTATHEYMLAFDNRAVMVLSDKATTVTIEGSMDGSTVAKTIISAQAVTPSTAYAHIMAGGDQLFRYYRITVNAAASPDTVSGWFVGSHITSY